MYFNCLRETGQLLPLALSDFSVHAERKQGNSGDTKGYDPKSLKIKAQNESSE